MRALSPSPVRIACLMHSSLITGSMPGIAASTSDTCELGSPPNAVEAPENSLERVLTWAWTSSPMTTSQSPVAPLMSFFGSARRTMASMSGNLARLRRSRLVYLVATAYIESRKQAQPWATKMTVHAPVRMTKEAFLAWVDQREERYEFSGGRVIMMVRVTRNHSRVTSNLIAALMKRLPGER